MDKFDRAQAVRQQILDYANRMGKINSGMVCRDLNLPPYEMGIKPDHAYRSMCKMVANGELQRHGSDKAVFFTPLKTETTKASVMRDIAAHKKLESHEMIRQENLRRQHNQTRKGRYVHRGMDRDHPIPNQGGQGAGNRSWGIQSSFSMV